MTRRTAVALLVAVVAALPACDQRQGAPGRGGGQPGARPGGRGPLQFPVQVEPVRARRVEYVVAAVGSVDAFEHVQVTARVAGVVEKVRFAEGDVVKRGQVLVEVEPERYELAVKSARAALERARAAAADAEASLARREQAAQASPGLIPGEELATHRTRVRTLAAETQAARVALDQAKLNLRDAYVRAPFGGAIQTRTVQTGSYVQPGSVLATLVRRDPLLLRFQVAEGDAARLRVGLVARFTVQGDPQRHSARVVQVAEAADKTTRQVGVTAQVVDPAPELRPGAFAQVSVPVGAAEEAPVIPQTAVRPSERGFLAYVVEGNVARERKLELGLQTADGLVEVKRGLRPGERLVVRGAEPLRDGAAVRVVTADGKPVGAPGAGGKPVPGAGAPGGPGQRPADGPTEQPAEPGRPPGARAVAPAAPEAAPGGAEPARRPAAGGAGTGGGGPAVGGPR